MKINLIQFTDVHWERSCSYRIDDVMQTLAKKFEQIKAYGNQYKVKAYLGSGDFFSQKKGEKIPYEVAIEATRQIKSLGRPVFAIAGNHDAYLGTIDKHPLKLMFESGVMIEANSKPKFITADPDGLLEKPVRVGIVGFNHQYKKDVEQFNIAWDDQSTPILALTHLVVGKEPGLFYKEEMYGIEEFTKSPIKAFFNGHIHTPLGPLFNKEKQIICQPGALRRTNTASEEIGRTPQVTLIEIEWEDYYTPRITCKYLPIEVETDIFRDYEKKVYAEQKIETNNFVDTVQNIRLSTETDIVEKVKNSEAEPEVKNLVLEHLE